MLQEALRARVEHHHGTLIEAAIDRAVARSLRRVGDLAFRAALDSGEGRRLAASVLVSQVGVDRATAIRRAAHSAAWQHLHEPVPTPPEANGVCQDTRTRS